jgi:hypothetical protein
LVSAATHRVDDGVDSFDLSYELVEVAAATRVT